MKLERGPRSAGPPFHTAGDRIRCYRTAWERVRDAAKLPGDLRMHDLRHRRVTTWLADGKSQVLVKEAVGHASLATTMRYTHMAREHLRSLVDPSEDVEELKRDLGT